MEKQLNEIIEKLGDYKISGKNLRFKKCPFCQRENYDFVIEPQKGVYVCHSNSCNKKGHINQLKGLEELDTYKLAEFTKGKVKTEKTPEELNKIFLNYKALSVEWLNYLEGRGITKKTADKIGRLGKFNQLAIPITNGKELTGIKYRTLEKKPSCESGSSTSYFINWQTIQEKESLIIVEGEIDLMSVIESGFNNAVSLPFGAGNLKVIDHQREWLKSFKNIIIAVDNDEPGEKCKRGIIEKLKDSGLRLYEVDLGEFKDLNEVLMAEGVEAVKKILGEPREIIQEVEKKEKKHFKNKNEVIDYFVKEVIPGSMENFQVIWGNLRQWSGKYWEFVDENGINKFIDQNYNGNLTLLKKDYIELTFQILKEVDKNPSINEPGNKFRFTFENGTLEFLNGDFKFYNNKFFREDYQIFSFNFDFEEVENPLNILGYSSLIEKWVDTKIDCNKQREGLKIEIANLFMPYYDSEIFTLIHGNPGNGKSSISQLIIGSINQSGISSFSLENTDPFSKVSIFKSIINFTGEISNGIIDNTAFKGYISRDYMAYRVAFSPKPVTARPTAKWISTGNDLPNIKTDGAERRRLFFIQTNDEIIPYNGDFKKAIKEDKKGLIKLLFQGLLLMNELNILEDTGAFNKILHSYSDDGLINDIILKTNPDAEDFEQKLKFDLLGELDFNDFFDTVYGFDDIFGSTKNTPQRKKERRLFRDRLERYIGSKGHKLKRVEKKPELHPTGKSIIRYYHKRKMNYFFFGMSKV